MINVKNLTKTYTSFERGNTFSEALKSLFIRKSKTVHALKGISFEIGEGELVGFLGPNGAGKSTTLKILTGILHPTSGEVKILDYTPWKNRKKYVGNIGAVFGQKSQLLWDIPPLDAFYMNKAIYGICEKDFKQTMDNMVEMFDVKEQIRKPTRQLSLGERMKCEFIMAMLHKPKIVFLDEPTIGLDVIAKDKIRECISQMNKIGVTFILTTHDLGDVEHLAKRVIVVNHGEVVFDDSLEGLKKYSGTKKQVSLSTHNGLIDLDKVDGIEVKNRMSQFDAEIEIDVSIIGLNEFMQRISEHCSIKDMVIQDVPIEGLIKEVYGRKK